ncbi:Cd209 antigen [Plakobranchus ocellatus]|uniref:Cd209 antigen n=1 Tax=Plakobranchus ocellatus TaxID=259542 RepID=A0AAV4C775_9GAST|nr:Cd209 antigen [Plakobranchus ocellatus]
MAFKRFSTDLNKAIKLRVAKPKQGDFLQLDCTFDRQRANFDTLLKLEVFETHIRGGDVPEIMATVNTEKVVYGMNESEIEASGVIFNSGKTKSELKVTWKSDDGYCRLYTCRAYGLVNNNSTEKTIYRAIKVQGKNDEVCTRHDGPAAPQKEDKDERCCSSADEIEANDRAIKTLTAEMERLPALEAELKKKDKRISNLENVVHELSKKLQSFEESTQSEQSCIGAEELIANISDNLNSKIEEIDSQSTVVTHLLHESRNREEVILRILSIDKGVYYVSSIFDAAVYIASRKDEEFDLKLMNDRCKVQGGYLVEFDSILEQNFVTAFLETTGNHRYYSGANDVSEEGQFVYFNSKRPVTKVRWEKGEPNNQWGREDCVEISEDGLNDKSCGKGRYVCELPLLRSSDRP